MINTCQFRDRARRGPRGFSLAEVVLAIGIVAFALLAILGVYGGMLGNSKDNIDRREVAESADALRAFLNDQVGFVNVYNWIRSGEKELVYTTYLASENGDPNTSSTLTLSRWFDPADAEFNQKMDQYEKARQGRWIKAKLSLSKANNPLSALPPDVAQYERALLALKVQFDAVPAPGQSISSTPKLTTVMGVLR